VPILASAALFLMPKFCFMDCYFPVLWIMDTPTFHSGTFRACEIVLLKATTMGSCLQSFHWNRPISIKTPVILHLEVENTALRIIPIQLNTLSILEE
jgi:hypothetical protein